jgi:superfamily II DNA or RNA helicase
LIFLLPAVFRIDELTSARNPIRQMHEPSKRVDGSLVTFVRDKLRGHLFQPAAGGEPILLVPPNTKKLPNTFSCVVGVVVTADSDLVNASQCVWLRHPIREDRTALPNNEPLIERILDSWTEAFRYTEEDPNLGRVGLRSPQIGAVHAIHAHWAVSESTATIVMPTGTGKTETMLSILISARCRRLLVIVPTDALRTQITDKFISLGILKADKSEILHPGVIRPIVGRLEHIPSGVDEVDDLFARVQVVVTTSTIAAQCSEAVQARFAHHCPYLFIDEAHHAVAPTWKEFKDHFGDCRVIQFTATPFREDDRPLDGDMIFKYPLKKAQKDGYFTTIHFEPIVEFNRDTADQQIALKAIECLERDFDKGHIVMARVDGVQRAKEIFEIYRQFEEFKPVELHMGIKSQRLREQARNQILSGISRIIICVDMLGEGFDLPQLKIAAFHDIRKSLAVTLQLAGRFTRVASKVGEATFIANVGFVNVRQELSKLYRSDPDWNVILPDLSEKLIGEQKSLQDFVKGFTNLPAEVALNAVEPASSVVLYKTDCEEWSPEHFREGIPNPDGCEQIYKAINEKEKTLVIVTARRSVLSWTDSELLHDWIWDLYVVIWSPTQGLLYINGSSNAGEFAALAKAVTGDRAQLIRGQEVFRAFHGIKRLILHNVGLSEHMGRSVSYTGRMGSNVGGGITQVQRGNAQKSVIDGGGYQDSQVVTIAASRKGRIWSHRRERLDKFSAWCKRIGTKVLDATIDPDEVLKGTLSVQLVTERPSIFPVRIDWPVSIYTEREEMWRFKFDSRERDLTNVSIDLTEPSLSGRLRFQLWTEEERVTLELEFITEGNSSDYRFVVLGDAGAQIKRGTRGQERGLADFFYYNPPKIWFADGSSLEGNQYVELKNIPPPYDVQLIDVWNWEGVDIEKESQGLNRQPDSIQARVIRELMLLDYQVVFDDDNSGEIADIVAIRVVGGMASPSSIEVDLYHCKFSGAAAPGGRIGDLYEVCGQAQKSIAWLFSDGKKYDMFTHLMRREKARTYAKLPTRFERGTIELLQAIREISQMFPILMKISVVQPGVSVARVSADQLRLLGVTENYLLETHELPFKVIASA